MIVHQSNVVVPHLTNVAVPLLRIIHVHMVVVSKTNTVNDPEVDGMSSGNTNELRVADVDSPELRHFQEFIDEEPLNLVCWEANGYDKYMTR